MSRKKVVIEQLLKDGFVQLKSKKQLIAEGILLKKEVNALTESQGFIIARFYNIIASQGITLPMLDLLGKTVPVYDIDIRSCEIVSIWRWPIECVKC